MHCAIIIIIVFICMHLFLIVFLFSYSAILSRYCEIKLSLQCESKKSPLRFSDIVSQTVGDF